MSGYHLQLNRTVYMLSAIGTYILMIAINLTGLYIIFNFFIAGNALINVYRVILMVLVGSAYLLVVGGISCIYYSSSGFRMFLTIAIFALIANLSYQLLFYWFDEGYRGDTTFLTVWMAVALIHELGYRCEGLHKPSKPN